MFSTRSSSMMPPESQGDGSACRFCGTKFVIGPPGVTAWQQLLGTRHLQNKNRPKPTRPNSQPDKQTNKQTSSFHTTHHPQAIASSKFCRVPGRSHLPWVFRNRGWEGLPTRKPNLNGLHKMHPSPHFPNFQGGWVWISNLWRETSKSISQNGKQLRLQHHLHPRKTETCPADQIIRFTTSLIFHDK